MIKENNLDKKEGVKIISLSLESDFYVLKPAV